MFMDGSMMAMTIPFFLSRSTTSRLMERNFSVSWSVLESALITLMPEISSRTIRTKRSLAS